MLFVPNPMKEVLHLSQLYIKGLPPVQGGSLDQTQWFTQASRFIQSELQTHRKV